MKQDEASEPGSYAPAVTGAGAAIALCLLSKIGELVVILLVWSAYAALGYAALHVVAAWLDVPLMAILRAAVEAIAGQAEIRKRAMAVVCLLKRSGK